MCPLRRRWLALLIATVICLLDAGHSSGQDTSRLRYIPSSDEIAQFFHGELSVGNAASAYDRDLHFMGEQPLTETTAGQPSEVYRLLVETRPDNIPIVIRLSIGVEGTGQLIAKVAQNAGSPDVLTMDKTTEISHADVDQFLQLLTSSAFWSMPVKQPLDPLHVVLGGADWLFEGETGGVYHVVVRSTPYFSSIEPVAMFLVDVAKIDLASASGAAQRSFDTPGCRKIENLMPNLQLREQVRVVGTIQGQRNSPLENSRVELRDYNSHRKQTAVRMVWTDNQGRFDLGLVPPGKYRLLASPDQQFSQPSTLDCQSGNSCELRIKLVENPPDEIFSLCPIR